MTLNELIEKMIALAAEEHFDGHAPVQFWYSAHGETKPIKPENIEIDDDGVINIEVVK